MTDEPVRSPTEVAAAIDAFTPADWLRLRNVAQAYALVWRLDKEDLLHEAFLRALGGERNCPVSVDVVRFLAEAIRSIANGEGKKVKRRREIPFPDRADPASPQIPEPAEASPDPLEHLIVEEDAARGSAKLIAMFGDDPVAQILVEGIMDGMQGDELRALTGLDPTGYASKRRLIRRRILKRKGGKP